MTLESMHEQCTQQSCDGVGEPVFTCASNHPYSLENWCSACEWNYMLDQNVQMAAVSVRDVLFEVNAAYRSQVLAEILKLAGFDPITEVLA